MLDGWYCRTIKNQNTTERSSQEDDPEPNVVDDSDDSQDLPVSHMMPRVDYKIQYNTLKKKLKFLLYVSIICRLQNKSSIIFEIIDNCACDFYQTGKRIFSRCASIKPTPASESDARPNVFIRQTAAIRETGDLVIGLRRNRIVRR